MSQTGSLDKCMSSSPLRTMPWAPQQAPRAGVVCLVTPVRGRYGRAMRHNHDPHMTPSLPFARGPDISRSRDHVTLEPVRTTYGPRERKRGHGGQGGPHAYPPVLDSGSTQVRQYSERMSSEPDLGSDNR